MIHATDRTTSKFAHTLTTSDVLVVRPPNGGLRLYRVAGTSRAAAANADRICIFLGDVDGSRIPQARRYFELDERVEVLFDELPALKRQSCRGHLETGENYTVGTLPTGDVRPYSTEILPRPDGSPGFFHYCDPCAERPEIRARLIASAIREIRRQSDELSSLAEPPAGEGDRLADAELSLRRSLLELPIFGGSTDLVRVYRHDVDVAGIRFPRCSRALGLDRCHGIVAPGAVQCSGHAS